MCSRTLTGSDFYHAGDISAAEAPSAVLEERLADAAETVLAEQFGSESGDELLAPERRIHKTGGNRTAMHLAFALAYIAALQPSN